MHNVSSVACALRGVVRGTNGLLRLVSGGRRNALKARTPWSGASRWMGRRARETTFCKLFFCSTNTYRLQKKPIREIQNKNKCAACSRGVGKCFLCDASWRCRGVRTATRGGLRLPLLFLFQVCHPLDRLSTLTRPLTILTTMLLLLFLFQVCHPAFPL